MGFEIVVPLLLVVAGAAAWIGYSIAKRSGPSQSELDELKSELEAARQTAESVQANVSDHFEQSAVLFGKLASDYREFLEHFSSSAQALGLSEARARELIERGSQPLLSHEDSADGGEALGEALEGTAVATEEAAASEKAASVSVSEPTSDAEPAGEAKPASETEQVTEQVAEKGGEMAVEKAVDAEETLKAAVEPEVPTLTEAANPEETLARTSAEVGADADIADTADAAEREPRILVEMPDDAEAPADRGADERKRANS